MKIIGGLALIAALAFIACIISTVMGAAVGWVVGLVFHDTIFDFLRRIGIDVTGMSMWQIGASLGFIGSFFRSNQTVKKDG